jgi:pyruvate dehydrogenase E2 component (dihydrolipoamide acetyltransferase)
MAREMEIDLRKIKGTGAGNRIIAEDVKSHAEKTEREGEPAAEREPELPDFPEWGNISREAMTRIRKITTKNVQQSWQTIPHVTHFDEADMTNLESFRKKYQDKIEKEGGKLTLTAIILKITGFALQKFPCFNASLDMRNKEIIYKHYYFKIIKIIKRIFKTNKLELLVNQTNIPVLLHYFHK